MVTRLQVADHARASAGARGAHTTGDLKIHAPRAAAEGARRYCAPSSVALGFDREDDEATNTFEALAAELVPLAQPKKVRFADYVTSSESENEGHPNRCVAMPWTPCCMSVSQ